MSDITESRLAMYEGIIALAWADHELNEAEVAGLHQLINDNPRFTDAQRATLHAEIDTPIQLADVWPRITDKYDRAYLLDIANFIFSKDGHFSEDEKELYDTFLAKHLDSIDSQQTLLEIREMAKTLRAQRLQDEANAQAEAKESFRNQFSLERRLKRFFE